MSRCSRFQYLPSLRWAHGLPVSRSGMTSITIMNPMSSKTCPASRPNTPPAKLSVMPAAVASPKAQEQADLGPGPQRVVDRHSEGVAVQRDEGGQHEEQRDQRGEAQQDKRGR